MRCIIIEDQAPAQRLLQKYIADFGSLQLIGTFSNAIDALAFIKKEHVDLIFLDIHLPKISGIDFLKALHNPPHIILTTAFSDYALESYDFEVVDYLLKPYTFQRFVKAVSRIPSATVDGHLKGEEHIDINRKDLYIKSGHEHIKINTDEIFYIQSDGDYSELFFEHSKILSSETLRDWLSKLDNDVFARVHKSYIVNNAVILKIVGNQIHLSNRKIIPIGRSFKDDFVKRFIR